MSDHSNSEFIYQPQADNYLGWRQYDALIVPSRKSVWIRVQQVMAGLAIICLTPLWLILYILVKSTSKGPFIYQQQRPGLAGVFFTAYKIRSMKVGADKDSARARTVEIDDPMITSIGKMLRDLKLDELPQLYNVFKGDMEFVGPRPIASALQVELEGKIPGFSRRLSIRPGLSSLAQISIFQNAESDNVISDWQTRFEAELAYLHQKSWYYDMVIIAMTALFIARKIWRRIPVKKCAALAVVPAMLLLVACGENMQTKSFRQADMVLVKDIDAYGSRVDPAILEIEPVRIDALKDKQQDTLYRLGTGDALKVNVFGEQGLSDILAQVDGSGNIQLPYLETVKVIGKTIAEVQLDLKEQYQQHFKEPWVVVNITDYKSRPVYLLGQFNKPGVIYMQGPTKLMQIISMGQGLSDLAHLRGARLWREAEIAPVDLYALLMDGKVSHNVTLHAGDTVFVPSKGDKKAYIMGAVARAGAVPFDNAPVTLLKALVQVGGVLKEKALLSQVRIIRTHSALEGQLILVDVNKALSGAIPDFQLMPDDIVYVPDNAVENWNQIIRSIIPSLQLAGGVLQPFVQYKFLNGE